MKTYIISFYQQEVSEDELVAFLQRRPQVLNLTRSLPNTVFVASEHSASSLTEVIGKKFSRGFFIVAEYTPYNTDGALPREMWNFLNEPKRARKAKKKQAVKRKAALGAQK